MDITLILNSLKILLIPLKLFCSCSPPAWFFSVLIFLFHGRGFPLTSGDPLYSWMGAVCWVGKVLIGSELHRLGCFTGIFSMSVALRLLSCCNRFLRRKSSNCLLCKYKPGYQCLQVGRRYQARNLSIQYVYRLLPKSLLFCMIHSSSTVTSQSTGSLFLSPDIQCL